MPSRGEFCFSCLALALAGWGAPRSSARTAETEPKEKNMMISCCGLNCAGCPAYIATRTDDQALREKTAREWSQMYQAEIKAADIHCDGCTSDSDRLFHHCTVCEFRACARGRKLPNCAHCPEYACAKLAAFQAQVPEAKATLDAVRKTL